MEASVNELLSISGKPRALCVQALKATNGDPNMAFEYLMAIGLEGADEGMFEEGYEDGG
jgi:translation elongation factor EF-Ts